MNMIAGGADLSISRIPDQLAPELWLGRRRGDRAKRDQVLMTRVGLRIPVNLAFEDWERAGHHLSGIVDSSAWCLGDWLVYGKKHYSERYRVAIRAAGLQYQTLRNYAWVSRRFELDRRRHRLSFQHHAEVASLPLDKQNLWLDRTEQRMWTTKQLRTHIRHERDGSEGERKQISAATLPIEVLDSQLVWWRKAADHTGIEFAHWVMTMLDRAAAQVFRENIRTEEGYSAGSDECCDRPTLIGAHDSPHLKVRDALRDGVANLSAGRFLDMGDHAVVDASIVSQPVSGTN